MKKIINGYYLKKLTLLLLLFSIFGCANFNKIGVNEAYVISPLGDKYIVGLRNDAKVTFSHSDGSTIEVDNRGKESITESLMKLYGLSVIKKED